MCTNCLQCTHMRRKALYIWRETLPGMHECTHAHNQNTQDSEAHLGSCRQREILKLALVCSLVFESNPADMFMAV